MSTEDRLHRLETVLASLVADVSEIKGELRWMRYILLGLFVQASLAMIGFVLERVVS